MGSLLGLFIPAAVALYLFHSQQGADRVARAEVAEANREQQQRQFDETHQGELRTLRRKAYVNYLRAANDWVVAQEKRETCRPGTDLPIDTKGPCEIGYFTGLQNARFTLRGAQNQMSYVESAGGSLARTMIEWTIPSAAPRDSGPLEGVVNDASFSRAYQFFQDQVVCDTSPEADTLGPERLIGAGARDCEELQMILAREAAFETTSLKSPVPR